MKKEIIINGIKYELVKKIDKPKEKEIDGIDGLMVISIFGLIAFIVSLCFKEWFSAMSFFLIFVISGFAGIDISENINKRLIKIEKKVNKKWK